MPGKTCHDVSGDKKIDWQLADGKSSARVCHLLLAKTEIFLERFFGAGEAVWGRGLKPVHCEHLPPAEKVEQNSNG